MTALGRTANFIWDALCLETIVACFGTAAIVAYGIAPHVTQRDLDFQLTYFALLPFHVLPYGLWLRRRRRLGRLP